MEKVKLPKLVAEEIQKQRSVGWEDFRIISYVHNQIRNSSILLSPMVKWAKQHQSPFMRALADGYEVEQTPKEQAIEYLKNKNDCWVRFSEHDAITEIMNILGVNADDR